MGYLRSWRVLAVALGMMLSTWLVSAPSAHASSWPRCTHNGQRHCHTATACYKWGSTPVRDVYLWNVYSSNLYKVNYRVNCAQPV